MRKSWLFKVGKYFYTEKLDLINLDDVNNYLSNAKKDAGFIVLENALININLIELVCDADLYTNGTIKL